jgi:hypothetical protein
MYDKKQRAKMMTEQQQQTQRELDDQLFHRRRRRWLVYGRAILTIATLGLLTVILYSVTHTTESQESHQEQRSRLINVDGGNDGRGRSVSIEDETVRKLNDDETAKRVESERVKRNVPKIVVNSRSEEATDEDNDIQLDTDEHHEKLQRRASNHENLRHRHSDGDVYYLRGYKCVPIKTSSQYRPLLAPPSNLRLPGMLKLNYDLDFISSKLSSIQPHKRFNLRLNVV